jgi:hypothetical protein
MRLVPLTLRGTMVSPEARSLPCDAALAHCYRSETLAATTEGNRVPVGRAGLPRASVMGTRSGRKPAFRHRLSLGRSCHWSETLHGRCAIEPSIGNRLNVACFNCTANGGECRRQSPSSCSCNRSTANTKGRTQDRNAEYEIANGYSGVGAAEEGTLRKHLIADE